MSAKEAINLAKAERLKRATRVQDQAPPDPTVHQRERFLDRLASLRQDLSLRAFSVLIGVPHSTIDSWKNPRAAVNMFHLLSIVKRASLPDVPAGRVSLDWLCGLTDEPDRNARKEVGDLPRALADHVAMEAPGKFAKDEHGNLKRGQFWISAGSYWRVDGRRIIEKAIEQVSAAVHDAHYALQERENGQRDLIESHVQQQPLPDSEFAGKPREQREKLLAYYSKERAVLAYEISHELSLAEFVRRMNASDAPLIFDEETFLRDAQRFGANFTTAVAPSNTSPSQAKHPQRK